MGNIHQKKIMNKWQEHILNRNGTSAIVIGVLELPFLLPNWSYFLEFFA
jgi:hypothetical protein